MTGIIIATVFVLLIVAFITREVSRTAPADGQQTRNWVPLAALLLGPIIGAGWWTVDSLLLHRESYATASDALPLPTLMLIGAVVGIFTAPMLAIASPSRSRAGGHNVIIGACGFVVATVFSSYSVCVYSGPQIYFPGGIDTESHPSSKPTVYVTSFQVLGITMNRWRSTQQSPVDEATHWLIATVVLFGLIGGRIAVLAASRFQPKLRRTCSKPSANPHPIS